MDTKAMAKSKRAHSQHLNQRHSTRKSSPNQTTTTKTTSNSTHSTSKAAKIQSLPIKQQTHNWDRYEEEEDEDELTPSKYDDVVKPKSKGADYAYLISEAKLNCFASLEDLVPDFYQGIGSILSVRGEGILSSTKDDNFVVENKGTTNYEAPFLSLNLHTLAEKLAKIDLSKRLFIQPGLLPPDLYAEESNASKKPEIDQKPNISESRTTTTISDEVNSRLLSEKQKVAEPNSEVSTSSDASKRLPAFDAASSETDLDMLLDSFNETTLMETSGSKKSDFSIPILEGSSKTLSFDDAIDDLLGETSSSLRSQQHESLLTRNIEVNSSNSCVSGPKSKVADDFDSWFDTI